MPRKTSCRHNQTCGNTPKTMNVVYGSLRNQGPRKYATAVVVQGTISVVPPCTGARACACACAVSP